MFTAVAFQTVDLKWLVPMIVGAVVLFGCVFALFFNRSWIPAVIGAFAVGLIGASVFNRVSLTTEGVIIETTQINLQALAELQKAAKVNSDAISQLTIKVNELAKVTQNIGGTQPADRTNASELIKIIQGAEALHGLAQQNGVDLDETGRKLRDQMKKLFKF